MIKKLVLMVSLTVTALTATAERFTPEQALERALQTPGTEIRALGVTATPQLVMTVTDTAGEDAAAYVFVDNGEARRGFVVVSASGLTAPVLGYSGTAQFDKDNLPPNFMEWMQGYAREIADIESGARRVLPKIIRRADTERVAIEPMVMTRWNQSEPYNNRCPEINGRRAVTGCMATAQAQVLNYCKYPQKLNGSISYTTTTARLKIDVSFDTIALDWDNMLNVYDKTSPEVSNQAVANLMYACGVASQMNYTPSASGASSPNSVRGMYNYFGFKDVGMLLGDWMNIDELEDYVYAYLTNHGPLLYCGQGGSGGHAFVCDGYSKDGYFHFNWGWGGLSDGYFRLNALDPGSQGIGGGSSGYNTYQQLLPGLHKPGDRKDFVPVCAADMGARISEEWNTVLGDTVMFEPADEDGGFWNFSADTLSVTFGARITRNATGESTYVACYGIKNYPLTFLRGWSGYPIIIPEQMEEGTYTIVPAYKNADGDWRDFYQDQNYQTSTLATVAGDSIKFEKPKPADILISNIEFETPCYAGGGFMLTADVIATGDRSFYGNVSLILGEYYGDDFVSDFQATSSAINARPFEATSFKYAADFTNTRLKGTYQLVFVNTETGVIVSEPIEVTIKPYPGEAIPEVVKAEIENAMAVDPNNVVVKADILSPGGYFSKSLYLSLGTLDGDNFELINRITSPVYYIEPGKSLEVSFSGAIAGQEGETFIARLEYYDAKTRMYIQIGEDMPFRIGGAGVGTVLSDDDNAPVRYFDLQGREVDANRLESGVYLLKQGSRVSKTVVR